MSKQFLLFVWLMTMILTALTFAQEPPVEPGVSLTLARWRTEHYRDVRYKLSLTLEKQSPTLKGNIEIRVALNDKADQIILDWRKISGKEQFANVSNVIVNDQPAKFEEISEHLVFKENVRAGENTIKLDFTSPIATSGAAVTRYVDKENGAEYVYSLFVPSDASTAFPCFDQPDLKARFKLSVKAPQEWKIISNAKTNPIQDLPVTHSEDYKKNLFTTHFAETQLISTYVFAFAAGDFTEFDANKISAVSRESGEKKVARRETSGTSKQIDFRAEGAGETALLRTFGAPKFNFNPSRRETSGYLLEAPSAQNTESQNVSTKVYVRKSQVEKFKQHVAEVFRLNREAVEYLETYFDYKFPFPKYDLVLIPEFPFGGMEHAGATFLREDRIIFAQEPTANDFITRGNLIFHEAAHQWFGDTVTMRWFDDLWLKEGFAEFMAYKTMEKVLPQCNAWKAFYERNKPLAYQTDSTRGTTAIYQEIANLSAAKSAYGNIVYRKAPSFLKQAEFYLGADKFQTAVRQFLKQNAFKNAEWKDLVKSFETATAQNLKSWAENWVKKRGMPIFRIVRREALHEAEVKITAKDVLNEDGKWQMKVVALLKTDFGEAPIPTLLGDGGVASITHEVSDGTAKLDYFFPNYQDYGYGIFLLDEKSRQYILANIQNEKDDFLRAMMWGALWDSVREAELAPRDYVELAIKNISAEKDELTTLTILSRVSAAMNYYIAEKQQTEFAPRLEKVLIDQMTNAETVGQRTVFYRAFVNLASTEEGKQKLKELLKSQNAIATKRVSPRFDNTFANNSVPTLPLKTKDKYDIVTKLLILDDKDAPKLLEDLIKTETSDDAKRYAYAARAGIATTENKAKFFEDFVSSKEISESYVESAFVPFNSLKHRELTLPFLEKALQELPNLKRSRKIFFINAWLAAFIGGQRDRKALEIVNKFLVENQALDRDLRLKVLENVDVIERSVKIQSKFGN